MRRKSQMGTVGVNILAWVITIMVITPFILIIINSLKTSLAASDMNLFLPDTFHWENFAKVIEEGKLYITFFNSLLYSTGSVLICTLLSSMAAYALSRNRSKLHKFLYFFIVLGISMPINFIALTTVMQATHLIDTQIGIILLYSSLQIPFNVFLIYGFIGKIPRDIDEAGVIDGCSPIQLFGYIILPLLRPVLVTVMVLTFLNTWNEFVLPLYFLGNSDNWPMTLAVYNFFGMYFKDWNLVCADIVLTSLPVVAIYLAGQKYIVSGMTAGAVKG